MPGLGLGLDLPQTAVRSGGVAAPDADALALIAAMATEPSEARKSLINTTVVALKSAGIWPLLDLLYVTAAHAQQAGHLNWKSPGAFALVPANAPTFTVDRGYQGNGTTSRLGTGGWIPATNGVNFALNDASLWSWTLTNLQVDQFDIGVRSDTNARRSEINPWSVAGRLNVFVNSASNSQPVVTTSVGMSGAQRTASNVGSAWRDGVLGQANAPPSTGLPTLEMWLCGANPTFSTRQVAFAAFGASLAGKEAQFYNAIRAYMTGVGVP